MADYVQVKILWNAKWVMFMYNERKNVTNERTERTLCIPKESTYTVCQWMKE